MRSGATRKLAIATAVAAAVGALAAGGIALVRAGGAQPVHEIDLRDHAPPHCTPANDCGIDTTAP